MAFDDHRVPYKDLYGVVEKSAVKAGGWEVPALNPRNETFRAENWLGQETDWSQYVEMWRIYESGQFIHYAGITADWWDQAHWTKVDEAWSPGRSLSVPEVHFRLLGSLELAARLSLTVAGGDPMHLEVSAHGLSGRTLSLELSGFAPFFHARTTNAEEFKRTLQVGRSELISAPGELALDIAEELFQRFDWVPSRELMKKHQDVISTHR
jgi:hypothetical protein